MRNFNFTEHNSWLQFQSSSTSKENWLSRWWPILKSLTDSLCHQVDISRELPVSLTECDGFRFCQTVIQSCANLNLFSSNNLNFSFRQINKDMIWFFVYFCWFSGYLQHKWFLVSINMTSSTHDFDISNQMSCTFGPRFNFFATLELFWRQCIHELFFTPLF